MPTYPESYHQNIKTQCSTVVSLVANGKQAEARQVIKGENIPYAHFMFHLIRTYMGREEDRIIELVNMAYDKPKDYDSAEETVNLFGQD